MIKPHFHLTPTSLSYGYKISRRGRFVRSWGRLIVWRGTR